jgi:hypothetical protein
MDESNVLLPTRCPQCGAISFGAYPALVVVTALLSWNQMRLYSSCHDVAWDASPSELQSIREYVGDKWLEQQQKQFATKRSSR